MRNYINNNNNTQSWTRRNTPLLAGLAPAAVHPICNTNQGNYLVYMHVGTNPFEVINQAVKAVEKYLQTFQHREKKKLPRFIDWFGWCTWDAFYTDVTAEGVEEGLKSLSEGGTPPRFLIIDDGWQQIGSEVKGDSNCIVQEGAQFANRLTGIKENEKLKKNGQTDEQESGLKHVVRKPKQQYSVNMEIEELGQCFEEKMGLNGR